MNKTKIFLADDHAILREGLRYILGSVTGYEIVGESGDGREALGMIEKLKPDIAIVDISMPGMTGIEIARQVRKYTPSVSIIILSRHDNEEYVNELLKLGVNGYVLKDNAGDDLLRAVAEVSKGNIYLSPRITRKIVTDYLAPGAREAARRPDSQFTALSTREREILKLIAEGRSNAEIASTLWISDKTVKVHRSNMMKKLDLHKVADLVKYAVKSGLVEP
ncbi:MAG TPA: response regulator transcription factor [Spirochaetota bacterium]|nr:response regulator transcription factor [Spirochaetota bacterium]